MSRRSNGKSYGKTQKKLLVLVREAIRRKHYSKRTEEAYIYWIKRYIFFQNKRHPQEMSNTEVEAFLTDLTTKRERLLLLVV
jgi:hypothetical protein